MKGYLCPQEGKSNSSGKIFEEPAFNGEAAAAATMGVTNYRSNHQDYRK